MLNRENRISLYVKKIFYMKKKKEWYLRDGTKLSFTSMAARKSLPSRCLCLRPIVILVLACVHTTPTSLGEGAPFFLRGGGSVHRLFSVCALGRLSFQFRMPTKPQILTLAKMSPISLTLLH